MEVFAELVCLDIMRDTINKRKGNDNYTQEMKRNVLPIRVVK